MRAAQHVLSEFLPLIDWTLFRRHNLNEELSCDNPGVAMFGCGDNNQAVVWLMRTNSLRRDGTVEPRRDALPITLHIPSLAAGRYTVTTMDPTTGARHAHAAETATDGLTLPLNPMERDLAIAVKAIS